MCGILNSWNWTPYVVFGSSQSASTWEWSDASTKGLFRFRAKAIVNEGQYVLCGMQMGPQGH